MTNANPDEHPRSATASIDWHAAKDLFIDLLDAPPAERPSLLHRRCGGDTTLAGVVMDLLAAHDTSDDFLDERAPTRRDDDHAIPDRVGPYELLEPLGEGGFGRVFRARQIEPIEREVAVKVLKSGAISEHVVERFRIEQDLLARMEHPGIARILDAGVTPGGTRYVAMDLVRGTTITRYCRQNQLGIRARVELVAATCRAVHHAHQRAVLHGDIKPSNILVTETDGEPTPRLIDFGVARLMATEGAAAIAADLAGTPRYMAPEQLNRTQAADVRADVYSLGVLLCEVLTGATPRETALSDEPIPATRPSDLAHRDPEHGVRAQHLRGDLDRIVMKCVAWDADDRYDSAAALADDITRFLRREAVLAGNPGAVYRASRVIGRHRVATGMGVLAAGGLIAGLLLAVHGRAEAIEQREVARAAEQRATKQANRAEFAATFLLEDMIAAADPDTAASGPVPVETLLAEAAERASSRFESDPEMLFDVLGRIGVAYSSLRRQAQAVEVLRQALAVGETLPDREVDLLELRVFLARNLWATPGGTDEARELRARNVEDAVLLLGPEHEVTLRARLDALPQLTVLADRQRADFAPALAELDAIESAWRRQAAFPPREELSILRHRGIVLGELEGPEASTATLEKAADLAAGVLAESHSERVQISLALAFAYRSAGQPEAALPIYEHVRDLRRKFYPPDYTGHLTIGYSLSSTLTEMGRHDEAIQTARDILDMSEENYGRDSLPVARALHILGDAQLRAGKPVDAASSLRRSIEIRAVAFGEDHTEVARTRWRLAESLRQLNQTEDALEQVEWAYRVLKDRPDDAPAAALVLAKTLRDAGRAEDAVATINETLTASPPNHRTAVARAELLALRESQTSSEPVPLE